MAASDPTARAQIGRIGAHKSWARTPDRSERTAKARAASPTSYEYWLAVTKAEGIVAQKDIPAAAENAWRAYQAEVSRKGVEARRRNAAARKTTAA